jgi:DNA repair protein RadC
MEKNIHSGHRERVRENYKKSGFDGFSDVNILEMLLFYSIPRKDTNVIAHNLLNEFGSISAVFDAPYDMLLKVRGITDNTATLISMTRELFKVYESDKIEKSKVSLDSAEKNFSVLCFKIF